MLREGNQTGVVGNPQSFGERVILATQCVSQYKFTMPMVIDGMDGKVNSDYQAAPVRVTIVDIDGKVAFYAGRGPADFRIPPVERTLKKLVANAGHMPPLPPLQWGEPVNGLRCGLSIDPNKPAVGEEIVARVAFENVYEIPLVLPCNPADMSRWITLTGDEGRQLKIEPLDSNRQRPVRRPDARRIGQRVLPGQVFEVDVEGRLMEAGSQETSAAAGPFHAVCRLEADETTATQVKAVPQSRVWVGRVVSGSCTFQIVPRR